MHVPRPAAARRLVPSCFVLVVALLAIACGADDPGQPTPPPVTPQESPWSKLAPLLQPRSEMAVAEVGGKLYVIGGYPPGRIPSDVVQVYDPATDSWTLGPATPLPLHHSIAVAVGGRLFLIGGEFRGAGTGYQPVYLSEVYELDVASGAWLPRAPMPTGRNHLAVDAIGGKLYVAGGRFDAGVGGPMTAVLEVFDPATGAWTTGAPMPAPRAGVTTIAAFGCLYVIGGEGNMADPRGMFKQTEAYDPRTNTWHRLRSMPTATHGLNRAAFLDGRIHVPGGATTVGGDTGSTLHQVYRPERRCDE